jgi:hypothetical protein
MPKVKNESAARLAGTIAQLEHVRAAHLKDPELQDISIRQLRERKECCAAAFEQGVAKARGDA